MNQKSDTQSCMQNLAKTVKPKKLNKNKSRNLFSSVSVSWFIDYKNFKQQ